MARSTRALAIGVATSFLVACPAKTSRDTAAHQSAVSEETASSMVATAPSTPAVPLPSAATAVTPPRPSADRLEIAVDKRVELLAILSRLAGTPSYLRASGRYLDEVDSQFSPYVKHPAVVRTEELRQSHGISFDAPMALAVYLDDKLMPIRPLSPLPPGMDDRWKGVDVDGYVALVRRFAQESGYDRFFEAHRDYYRSVEKRFADFLGDKKIVAFFDDTFGPRAKTSFHVAPSPEIWPMNYGVRAEHLDGAVDIDAVMLLENPKSDWSFEPTDTTLELVAHEICHSYVNPIVDAHATELDDAAGRAFKHVEKAMRAQHYTTPEIVAKESIVRAMVLVYLRAAGRTDHADKTLKAEQGRSFLWTEDLATAFADAKKAAGGTLTSDIIVRETNRVLGEWVSAHPSR